MMVALHAIAATAFVAAVLHHVFSSSVVSLYNRVVFGED